MKKNINRTTETPTFPFNYSHQRSYQQWPGSVSLEKFIANRKSPQPKDPSEMALEQCRTRCQDTFKVKKPNQ